MSQICQSHNIGFDHLNPDKGSVHIYLVCLRNAKTQGESAPDAKNRPLPFLAQQHIPYTLRNRRAERITWSCKAMSPFLGDPHAGSDTPTATRSNANNILPNQPDDPSPSCTLPGPWVDVSTTADALHRWLGERRGATSGLELARLTFHWTSSVYTTATQALAWKMPCCRSPARVPEMRLPTSLAKHTPSPQQSTRKGASSVSKKSFATPREARRNSSPAELASQRRATLDLGCEI